MTAANFVELEVAELAQAGRTDQGGDVLGGFDLRFYRVEIDRPLRVEIDGRFT